MWWSQIEKRQNNQTKSLLLFKKKQTWNEQIILLNHKLVTYISNTSFRRSTLCEFILLDFKNVQIFMSYKYDKSPSSCQSLQGDHSTHTLAD